MIRIEFQNNSGLFLPSLDEFVSLWNCQGGKGKNMKFSKLLRTMSLKRAQKIMKSPTNSTPTRSAYPWKIDVEFAWDNSHQFRMSCDVTSDFNLEFLAIERSHRCVVCGCLHCFLSSCKWKKLYSSPISRRLLAKKLDGAFKSKEHSENDSHTKKGSKSFWSLHDVLPFSLVL